MKINKHRESEMAKKRKSNDGQLRLRLDDAQHSILSGDSVFSGGFHLPGSGGGQIVSLDHVRKGNARDFLVNELRKSGIYEAMKKK